MRCGINTSSCQLFNCAARANEPSSPRGRIYGTLQRLTCLSNIIISTTIEKCMRLYIAPECTVFQFTG
jgi:hypothetical protein